jgi:hypothetical protein
LKPPASWQAYDYYMRGADILAAYWSTVKAVDLHESRRLLEKSLAIDPNFARAYSSLSTTYVIAWRNRLDEDHLNPRHSIAPMNSRTARSSSIPTCRTRGRASARYWPGSASTTRRSPSSTRPLH